MATRRADRWIPLLTVVALLPGCGPRLVQLGSAAEPEGAAEAPPPDWSDWGRTLSRVAVGEKVDYEALLADHQALDRFLARMGRQGPQSTPAAFADRDSRLAYFINGHNAAVLRSVLELAIERGLPARVPGDLDSRFRFHIDGRAQTPAELRRAAMDLAGDDWRVRLALYDARSVGPPLLRHPFAGDLLDAQLNQTTRAALASPRVVSIDYGEDKRLLVWPGLYPLRERLVSEYERRLQTRGATLLNVLLDWSDRPRREVLNTAIGYQVAVMPEDDRLDSLAAPTPSKSGLAGVLRSIQSITFLRPQR
jgi:hypothetical protein